MFSKTDAERIVRQNANREIEAYRQEEFDKVDSEALRKMPDKELAKWQYRYTEGEERAEVILAKYEWQRRLVVEQVKATRNAAWISIVGVFLGYILASFPSLVDKLSDVYSVVVSHSEPERKGSGLTFQHSNRAVCLRRAKRDSHETPTPLQLPPA